ncbi:MAG TPA: Rv3235 family protein, partial [Mycobacteriales bacterium]|nr:Rv3235 family protein [Mycobacteriales bacterium]
ASPGTLTRAQAQPAHVAIASPATGRLPDPRGRAITIVRALVEVMAGDRPASHLARYATLDVQQVLRGLVPPTTARQRPWGRMVRSIHVAEPTPSVLEVTAVVHRGERCAAVALRLEARATAWVMTALEVG